jgi:hypothetical protein
MRQRCLAGPPYLDAGRTPMTTTQSEIDDLIAQMTLAEKAGQLTQYF